MNGKLSSLSTVIFFVNGKDPNYPVGYHMLAPYSQFETPWGWDRREATDLREVDMLQAVLLRQEKEKWEKELLHDEVVFGRLRDKVRDNLQQALTSGASSEFEKDFIREYLKLRIEKREKHRANFEHRSLYLHAREFDTPKGREMNEESVSLDRLEVKP